MEQLKAKRDRIEKARQEKGMEVERARLAMERGELSQAAYKARRAEYRDLSEQLEDIDGQIIAASRKGFWG